MAENTPNLGLYKKNPLTDGDDTFNIETMLNENWDKIDQKAATKEELQNIEVPVTSVNNKTGDVTLTKSDVGLSNVNNVEQATKQEHDQLVQKVDDNEQEISNTNQTVAAHLADYVQFKEATENELLEIGKQLNNYNQYASNKGDNGIFTVVEYKRQDDTLYMKSTLSNTDSDGNYQTNTWEFYNEAGDDVINTIVWTITFDDDGDISSKEWAVV